MLSEKRGNVVVLAGNNTRKTDYILKSVQAGLNVLADKPMAITPADFEKLREAFTIAADKRVLLYDIMTERYEITTILQRELSRQPAVFGELVKGSPSEPAITKESVHHFSKIVSGSPLKRPAWYFDVRQEGEGIVDVTTHLVDLVQWEAFPEQSLNPADVKMLNARRWNTAITRAQFKQVTGAEEFPDFLKADVKDGVLQVSANGEFTYQLRGVHAKVSVTWNFEAPPGAGDRHYSMMRGTRANLVIRQGPEQKYKPVLYVEPATNTVTATFEAALKTAIAALQGKYSGIGFERDGYAWRVTVPEKYDVGHEAHFAQVAKRFFRRTFELPEGKAVVGAVLRLSVDDRLTVYLNGKQLGSHADWQTGREFTGIAPLLTPGKNADIVVMRLPETSHPETFLLEHGGRGAVEAVMAGGVWRVREGQSTLRTGPIELAASRATRRAEAADRRAGRAK